MNKIKLAIRMLLQWAAVDVSPAVTKKAAMKINEMETWLNHVEPKPVRFPIQRPVLPPGVIPVGAKTDPVFMATDSACGAAVSYACTVGMNAEGFPGYTYLAQLQQISEYRSPSETTAMEMTRKWIEIVSHGDGDKAKKIEQITAEMERHGVRDMFRMAAEQDGFFGRSQIYIKIKEQDGDDSRKLPLILDKRAIAKGSLLGFCVIEPVWTTPYSYSSIDPTAPDFYKPSAWFVLGKQTHASRLLNFVSRPVPDILKPAYNFGGMSMSQLMESTINSWLETKAAVADLIHSYSTSGLKTNMSAELMGGTFKNLFARMKTFVNGRKNRGLMVIDKDSEDFFQFNAPLSGLDALQAQSQEHMAAPCHMPLVKLLGITPTGLNASAEPEMDAWRDYIGAMQQNLFGEPLMTVLNLIQLDLFGDIDPSIGFEFIPIEQPSPTEEAAARKADADGDVALVGAGILSPEESRKRLAADPKSGYSSLNVSDVPEPPTDPDAKPDDGFNADE